MTEHEAPAAATPPSPAPAAFPTCGWVPMGEQAWERAAEVQQLLTETGQHRSAGAVDLLIAATAERERLTVLCDDRDFETVAAVTRQPIKLVTDI